MTLNRENELLRLARETLQDEGLTLESRLSDAKGYDSLAHVQLMIEIRDAFGVDLDNRGIERGSRIAQIYQLLNPPQS